MRFCVWFSVGGSILDTKLFFDAEFRVRSVYICVDDVNTTRMIVYAHNNNKKKHVRCKEKAEVKKYFAAHHSIWSLANISLCIIAYIHT